MAVLPVDRITWGIREAFQLANGFSKHGGVIFLIDDPIANPVLFEKRRTKPVVPKPSSTLPANGFRDSALVRTINNLLHTRDNVRVAVFAQLHTDPPSPHLMPYRTCCARTGKGIEHPVIGVGT